MITPIIRVGKNLFVKMDMFNETGSHKVRAAKYIVSEAINRGDILPGVTTVIEKTGGNFGFGLVHACKEFGVNVELAVGLSFSRAKRKYLEAMGAKLIGLDMLKEGATPREVVEAHLKNGKDYYYTDQFNNYDGVLGHLATTGPEISRQLQESTTERAIIFVACAGTGASLTAIRNTLIKDGFEVETCLVEPEHCDSENGVFVDHRLEGMAVGVTPPFVDWSTIDSKIHVSQDDMLRSQRAFFSNTGHLIGNTSAACYYAADKMAGENPGKTVFTMVYDHGLWYDDLISTSSDEGAESKVLPE